MQHRTRMWIRARHSTQRAAVVSGAEVVEAGLGVSFFAGKSLQPLAMDHKCYKNNNHYDYAKAGRSYPIAE